MVRTRVYAQELVGDEKLVHCLVLMAILLVKMTQSINTLLLEGFHYSSWLNGSHLLAAPSVLLPTGCCTTGLPQTASSLATNNSPVPSHPKPLVLVQLLEEGAVQHLALPRLQSVHHAGDGALHVVLGPQHQLFVHEILSTGGNASGTLMRGC